MPPASPSLLDEGGKAAYDRVLTAYEAIDNPAFGQSVALALGSVTDPAQAARTRELIASAELGPRETYTMALLQMQSPETRKAMWESLEGNFPAFLKAIPAQWKRRTPAPRRLFLRCDDGDADGLASLDALFAEYGDQAEGHERALSQARENINLCIAQKGGNRGRPRNRLRRDALGLECLRRSCPTRSLSSGRHRPG